MLESNKQDPFDALVANWIGELGQLHQLIKKLPIDIDATLTPTKKLLHSAQVGLAQQLSALPGAADKEMKRASAETISVLAAEVAKIARQISDEAAAAERHKSFFLAAGLLSISSTIFFGAGVYIESRGFSWVMLVAITLLLGIAGGMGLLIMLSGIEKDIQSKSDTSSSSDIDKPYSLWTDSEFPIGRK